MENESKSDTWYDIRSAESIPQSRVLIVDDNPAKLAALKAALEGMDIEIVTAASGMEALHSLLDQDFAAILLDVNMPIMDGFDTATMIRSRKRSEHLPILFITAERLDDCERLKGYELGAVDYITSPVLPQILRSKVAMFADLYRLREQGRRYGDETVRQNLIIALQNENLEKQVEARTAQLRESEKRLQNILASTQTVHYACRADGVLCTPTFVSANLKEIFGYDCAECLGNAEWWWSGIHPEERDSLAEAFHAGLASGFRHYVHEYRFLHKNGNYRWIRDEIQIISDKTGKPQEIIGSWMDITERRQAEVALRESEEKFRAIFECAIDGILLADAVTKQFVTANPEICRMLGYSTDELTRLGVADIHVHQELPYVLEQFGKLLRGDIQVAPDIQVIRKDGSIFYASIKGSLVSFGGKEYLAGIFRDTTARRQAEAEIRHANRALASLSAVNRALVHAIDENKLMQNICQAIVEQNGYRMAWVGYKQQEEDKSIRIMAYAGIDEVYLDALLLTCAETERCICPCGCVIRSSEHVICQDIAHDQLTLPWREAALQHGYASYIALPLAHDDKSVFGTLAVYSDEVNAFIPAEIAMMEEMATDLAFGVKSLQVRRERDQALEQNRQQLAQLQGSLDDTVRAISSMLEMRDPYTSGHQSRVADLAAAIARQMGLQDEQIKGIHLAGMLHDLGKIKIPAEILSKPGRISEAELTLIKCHPQAGHDILQGINFPWPVALMVLQHHERMDGSGYPQGLKGDDILLEARILSVADVTEAILSHRPYRAGLGVEVALAEITNRRGSSFDPQAVDACLALFREQHYAFN